MRIIDTYAAPGGSVMSFGGGSAAVTGDGNFPTMADLHDAQDFFRGRRERKQEEFRVILRVGGASRARVRKELLFRSGDIIISNDCDDLSPGSFKVRRRNIMLQLI